MEYIIHTINMSNKILTINAGSIDYTITYCDAYNLKSVRFDASHKTLGFKWVQTVSDVLNESTNEKVRMSIDPGLLFKIINDYVKGSLNEFVTMKFQSEIKDTTGINPNIKGYSDLPLQIEIITRSVLDPNDYDTKFIMLQPDESITTDYINSQKIKRLYDENEILMKKIHSLEQSLTIMKGENEKKTNELSDKYATSDKAIITIAEEIKKIVAILPTYYTKKEVDDKFVSK